MDNKEKLELARDWYNDQSTTNKEKVLLENLFPELKESEDERIRKKLIKLFTTNNVEDYGGVTNKQIVAWLEKQGEKSNYNPYKVTVESIAAMVEKYVNGDLIDFYDNVKVKCKDAMEYNKIWLEKQGEPQDKGEISDGYHTFNELYYYRMLYNASFFNMLPKEWVHKSKRHNDGEECFGGGWFIVMANLPTGQISNHYELKDWDLFQIPEKEVADKWDGHTPQEAADRLHKYLLEKQDMLTFLKQWTGKTSNTNKKNNN